MAHVPLLYDAKGAIPRAARSYTKKKFGQMVQPTAAASNHSGVLLAMGALEMTVAKRWKKLDPTLRWLAVEVASAQIGCSWCIDYGYYEGMNHGVDPAKVRAALQWRDSDLFDDRERTVLEYAEAATQSPVEVSEDLVRRLHLHFTDAEIVELAGWVALENYRSRFNAGLGLHSEGFADKCEIPPLMSDVADASDRRVPTRPARLTKTWPPSRNGDRCSSGLPIACWAVRPTPRTWCRRPASAGSDGAMPQWNQCGPIW